MPFKATRSQKTSLTVTLCAVLAMSVYFYGWRVLFMTAFTVAAAVVFDYIGMCLLGKKSGERLSMDPVITAVVFSLCLSAATPYWVALYGMLFAIVVAKIPFGGTGKNVFNPAAVGLAFAGISFPGLLFQYPAPYFKMPLFGLDSVVMHASPGAVLQAGGSPEIDTLNVLLANYSGPIGTTAVFVLAAAGLYLALRRAISWRIVVSALVSFSAVAFFFRRTGADGFHSVAYELMSGIFLFAVVFMASDPVTSPKNRWGQVLFGVFLGVGTMAVRFVSSGEFSVVFPLLIANALAPVFDRAGARALRRLSRAKPAETGGETEITVEDARAAVAEALAIAAGTAGSAEDYTDESVIETGTAAAKAEETPVEESAAEAEAPAVKAEEPPVEESAAETEPPVEESAAETEAPAEEEKSAGTEGASDEQ